MKNPRLYRYCEGPPHGSLVWELSEDDLWNISAEILTELSRRDEVQYRVSATNLSVRNKLEKLENEKKVAKLNDPPKRLKV